MTIGNSIFVLALLSALGSGLIAGVFFAFSTFVMRALAQLPSAQGIAAMQSINVTVLNRWFLGAFFGTAAACLVLALVSLVRLGESGAGWLLAGSGLYLGGTFLVTVLCNVPWNNSLAAVKAGSPEAVTRWRLFLHSWTAWNHVRTVAALAAAAAFVLGLVGRHASAVAATAELP